MILTDSQLAVGMEIVNSVSSRITLAGLAGTGKTTLSHWAYKEWVKQGHRVCVLAPTGKAAMVLNSKGVPATTVHSAIYLYKGQFESFSGDIELIFKPHGKGLAYDRLIVDEASMITERMRDDIQELDIPTLWVGDPGQLKPVKSKPNRLLEKPDFTLKEIHRQAAGNPIIQYAYRVRNGAPLSSRHEGISHVSVAGKGPSSVASEIIDRGIDRLIVRRNDQRVAVNAAYRRLMGRTEIVEAGDEIICVNNNKRCGIVNGEIFRVTEVVGRERDYTTVSALSVDTKLKHRLSVWNSQFGLLRKTEEEVDQVFALCDYAKATTCHKAQGSSWEHVAVAAKSSEGDDSKEWCYTAVTRAESRLTILC
jgi:exodeoxyribonuclease V